MKKYRTITDFKELEENENFKFITDGIARIRAARAEKIKRGNERREVEARLPYNDKWNGLQKLTFDMAKQNTALR